MVSVFISAYCCSLQQYCCIISSMWYVGRSILFSKNAKEIHRTNGWHAASDDCEAVVTVAVQVVLQASLCVTFFFLLITG